MNLHYAGFDSVMNDTERKRPDLGFVHEQLGPLTSDEVLFMRQIPAGFEKAVWTKDRLEEVRRRISLMNRR